MFVFVCQVCERPRGQLWEFNSGLVAPEANSYHWTVQDVSLQVGAANEAVAARTRASETAVFVVFGASLSHQLVFTRPHGEAHDALCLEHVSPPRTTHDSFSSSLPDLLGAAQPVQ